MVHDARSPSIGEKLGAIAEQSARGNLVKKTNHSLPRILHLNHRGASRSQLLDNDAEELFGHIDGKLLVWLETLTLRTFACDNSRPRHLELISFAAHRLHQNRQVQLAATRNGPRIGGLGVFHA